MLNTNGATGLRWLRLIGTKLEATPIPLVDGQKTPAEVVLETAAAKLEAAQAKLPPGVTGYADEESFLEDMNMCVNHTCTRRARTRKRVYTPPYIRTSIYTHTRTMKRTRVCQSASACLPEWETKHAISATLQCGERSLAACVRADARSMMM